MSIVEKVEARSSVEIMDSCNCNECCPRICCCWPFGRKVVKHDHKLAPHLQKVQDSELKPSEKVQKASEPTLQLDEK